MGFVRGASWDLRGSFRVCRSGILHGGRASDGAGGILSSVVRWVSGGGAGRWFIAVASFEVFLIFLKIRSSYVVRVSATR